MALDQFNSSIPDPFVKWPGETDEQYEQRLKEIAEMMQKEESERFAKLCQNQEDIKNALKWKNIY